MQIVELRGKTEDELKTLLTNLKKEAFNLRFQKVSGELANTARVRVVRRSIARINTLLNDDAARTAAPAKTAKPKKEKKEAAPKAKKAEKPVAKKEAAPKKKAKTA